MSQRATPLKVAVLCSHRAPGLVQLLNTDRRRGRDYDIVCCITSAETFAEEVKVERRGVPCLPHPIRAWCRARGTQLRDLEARKAFDAETMTLLEPFNPDLLLLDGYLLLLTDPVLRRFEGRIVNVHHSDLVQRDESGRPRYPGLRAVRDAILAGEPATRATAHVVTDDLDAGPVMLRSWRFPVSPIAGWALSHDAQDVLRAYVWAHQEWMLRTGWPAMLARTLELASLSRGAAGRRLNLLTAGRWALEEDGSLAPDETIAADRLLAAG